MTISNKHSIDMTNGNLAKKLLIFAIPLMLSNVLQLLYNACDIIVIGQFRDHTALSAISSTGSLINLITNIFIGLSIGSNILLARCYGSKDEEKAKKISHTSVLISIIFGIILALFGFVYAKDLLLMMDSPTNVIDQATIYVQIYFLGMPFNLLYNFGSSLLRASGDTKRPMIYLLISGLVNVLANLFFVLVLNMSTDGVAIATVLSQILSSILVLLTLMIDKGYYHISLKNLKIDLKTVGQIATVGIPAGLQSAFFSISNVLIQSSINSFGSYVMAGNGAASNLEGFVHAAMICFYHASLAFTSQNYGAKKYDNIPKILKYSIYYTIFFGGILGMLAYGGSGQLLKIYTNDPEVVKIGVMRLGIVCVTYYFCGIMDVLVGSIRGMGYSIYPMIATLIGVCGVRIFWVLLIFKNDHNLGSLYASYPISWILTASIHFIAYLIFYNKLIKINNLKGLSSN